MHLILSYFDGIQGPTYLLTSNPALAKMVEPTILNLMDVMQDCFFQYSSEETDLYLANYKFSIPSEWARGKIEHLMITVVIDPLTDPKSFKRLLERFVQKINATPNAFKGIYIKSARNDPEIPLIFHLIENAFKTLLQSCEDALKEIILGYILVIGMPHVGKSTIIRQITHFVLDPRIRPTIEYQILKVFVENIFFQPMDMEDQTSNHSFWRQSFILDPKAIVFVLSCDMTEHNFRQSLMSLNEVLTYVCDSSEAKKNIPLLVLVNKMDLYPDYPVEKVESFFVPSRFRIHYHIGMTSAIKNIGLIKHFRWLIARLIEIE